MEVYTAPADVVEMLGNITITVHEQYYRVEVNGDVEIVRRHSKCTSGYMSPYQIGRIEGIEESLAYIKIGENIPDVN